MIAQSLLLDGIGHIFPFFVIGHQSDKPDLLARRIIRPQVLGDLALIVPDHFIGNIQDALGAAIVLFQLHHLYVVVVLLELQDILNGSPTEAIDALCIVTDHAYILMCGAQQFNDLVLRGIGILVLVDQDILEFMLKFMEALGEVSSAAHKT